MNQIATVAAAAASPAHVELAKFQDLPPMALLNYKGDLETSA